MSDDIHALSGAYAVDAIDDVERAHFERHLAGCPDCRAEVASLRAAASQLVVLTESAPPPSLRAKVLSEISKVRPLPPLAAPQTERGDDTVQPSAPAAADSAAGASATGVPTGGTDQRGAADELRERRRSRSARLGRGWRLVVAAATVTVLAIGGFTVWRQVNTDPTQVIADQVLAAADRTSTVKRFPDGSSATVWRSASLHRAVIVTSKMADAPSGKVYQLWLQDPTGHMASAGVMPSGPDHVVVLEGDASKATGAGITVEPAGGSGQPTSEPIALFAFA